MAKLNLAALNKTSQTNISETFSIEEDSVLVDWITDNWLNEVVSNKIPEEKIETKVENTAKICFKPKITLKDLNIETTNEVKKETIIEPAIENKQITKQKITLDKSWNWISLKVKPQIVEEKVTDNEIKQEIKNISEIEINNETENKNNQKSKREMITEQFNFQEYKNREQSDNTTYYTNDILVEEIVAKFPIVKEFHPNDYFKRVKIFYPNGSIHKIGKILGENVEFDNWKIYNEKGELTSEENKNEKYKIWKFIH